MAKSDRLTGSLVWSYRVPGHEPSYSSPIATSIAGTDVVVFQSWDWYAYVLNRATGALVWRNAFGDVNYGRPQAYLTAAGATRIFAASHDGTLRCLDAAGATLWTHRNLYAREGTGTATGGSAWSLVDTAKSWASGSFQRPAAGVAQNASVHIVSGPGAGQTALISGVDPTTLWFDAPLATPPGAGSVYEIVPRYPTDVAYQHAGTLSQESGAWYLYLTGFDGQCVKLAAATGAVVWRVSAGENIEPYPLVEDVNGDGQLEATFACVDGKVYCRAAATGAALWTTQVDPAAQPCDAFLATTAGTGTVRDLLVACRSNRVHRLAGNTGAVTATSTDMQGDLDARPAVLADGSYAVAGDAGFVYCLNPDASTRWRHQIGVGVNASPAVADLDQDGQQEILVADMSGTVTVLDPTGQVVGALHLPGGIEGTPLVGDLDGDGHVEIVACTLDGYCQMWRFS